MKLEERNKLIANIPEKHKKAFIFGVFGGFIGAMVGGYFSLIEGNILYAGVGAGVGFLVGEVFGLSIHTKVSLERLFSVQGKVNPVVRFLNIFMAIAGLTVFFSSEKIFSVLEKANPTIGILSILMATAGITLFFSRGDWGGIACAVFFGSVGGYLIFKPFKRNENLINGLLGIVFALTGLYAFIQTRNWIHLVGIIFFGLGGIFLIYTGRSR